MSSSFFSWKDSLKNMGLFQEKRDYFAVFDELGTLGEIRFNVFMMVLNMYLRFVPRGKMLL
jgi:hypothetical protein